MQSCDLKLVLMYDIYCQGDRKIEYSTRNAEQLRLEGTLKDHLVEPFVGKEA